MCARAVGVLFVAQVTAPQKKAKLEACLAQGTAKLEEVQARIDELVSGTQLSGKSVQGYLFPLHVTAARAERVCAVYTARRP